MLLTHFPGVTSRRRTERSPEPAGAPPSPHTPRGQMPAEAASGEAAIPWGQGSRLSLRKGCQPEGVPHGLVHAKPDGLPRAGRGSLDHF